jgi:hypothetical protein
VVAVDNKLPTTNEVLNLLFTAETSAKRKQTSVLVLKYYKFPRDPTAIKRLKHVKMLHKKLLVNGEELKFGVDS